jgi:hypothetical protein
MQKVKVHLDELEAAIAELKARSMDKEKIEVTVDGRQVRLSCMDRNDNYMEAILYDDGNLGAEFRMTHRLKFMNDKKGSL